MNRIFHARIAIGQYLFLVLTTIIVIYAMWMQHAVMAVLFMLLLVIAIERLIHTTYTLTTDDRLLLFTDAFPFGGNIPERHYLCGTGLIHENRTFRRDALCAGEVRNEGEMCRAASGEGRYVHKNPYESFK